MQHEVPPPPPTEPPPAPRLRPQRSVSAPDPIASGPHARRHHKHHRHAAGAPRDGEMSHAQRVEMAVASAVPTLFSELRRPYDTLRIGSWNLHAMGASVSAARLRRVADVLVNLSCQVVLLQGVTGGRETFWRLVCAMNAIDRMPPIQAGAVARSAPGPASRFTVTEVSVPKQRIAEQCFHGGDADDEVEEGTTVEMKRSRDSAATAATTGAPVDTDDTGSDSSSANTDDGDYTMLEEGEEPVPMGTSQDAADEADAEAESDEEASDAPDAWRADGSNMGAWRGVSDGVEFAVVWRDAGLAEQGTNLARVRGVFSGLNGASLRAMFIHPAEYRTRAPQAPASAGASSTSCEGSPASSPPPPPTPRHAKQRAAAAAATLDRVGPELRSVPIPTHVLATLGYPNQVAEEARIIPFRLHPRIRVLERTPMWVLLDTRHGTGVRRQVLVFNVNLRYASPADLQTSMLNLVALRPSKFAPVATLVAGAMNVDRLAGARQAFVRTTLQREAPHYLACAQEHWSTALSLGAPTNLFRLHPTTQGAHPLGHSASAEDTTTVRTNEPTVSESLAAGARAPRMLDNFLFLRSQWHAPVHAFASRLPFAFTGPPAAGPGPGLALPSDIDDALERQLSTHRPVCVDLRTQPADPHVTLAPKPLW